MLTTTVSDPSVPGKMFTRFFGISPRDTVSLDPEHRLLLEVSWEAMENDGHIPKPLEGQSTGVFVSFTVNDYQNRL
ncbi:MAG: hypothetical protein F6K52_25120 [Moorea sp. SIO3H5]|nr:hypothetical protein [Moorena sp. SIO3H5]